MKKAPVRRKVEIADNINLSKCNHIVYVTAALPVSSGETFIVPEIAEFQKRGHRVTVIPVRPRRSIVHEDARRLTDSTIAAPVLSPPVISGALAEFIRSPARIIRSAFLLASSRNIKIFLKNLIVFPKGVWLARVARQKGVDHIHAHWAATSATVALVASVISGIPWSFTAHRWDIPENNLLNKKVESAKFVRTIDNQGRRELTTLVKSDQHKIRVIHMGVVTDSSAFDRRKKSPEGILRVLLAARFVEVKGHKYALEAVARLKEAGVNVLLYCAGNGTLETRIKKQAKALNILDRVRFLGLIDHQELVRRLGEHHWDVALITSIITGESVEGIPVFLIEAMAAGIPVVATSTGGIPELIGGGAGILVPQKDAETVADALAKLAVDSDYRRQLAVAGSRRVREHFTIEAAVSNLLDEICKET